MAMITSSIYLSFSKNNLICLYTFKMEFRPHHTHHDDRSELDKDVLDQQMAALSFEHDGSNQLSKCKLEEDNRPLFVRRCDYVYKIFDGGKPNRWG